VIDYLCKIGRHREVYFHWRPFLRDPKDDILIELAVVAGAKVVTFNTADFFGADTFGVIAISPQEFLAGTGI
jgi:hypothetical protein